MHTEKQERRAIQFAGRPTRWFALLDMILYDPVDKCIHGKYCGRFKLFVTTRDHTIRTRYIEITVPAGSVTDFASVPWPLTIIYPRVGPYALAALVHDQLYIEQQCSRATADAIFREIMEDMGVAKWQRLPIYYAVRLGGAKYWRARSERARNAEEDKKTKKS